MYNRLNSYIENNNILSSTQFGFRKGIDTEDAILEFLDDAFNSINKSEYLAAYVLTCRKPLTLVIIIFFWGSFIISGLEELSMTGSNCT